MILNNFIEERKFEALQDSLITDNKYSLNITDGKEVKKKLAAFDLTRYEFHRMINRAHALRLIKIEPLAGHVFVHFPADFYKESTRSRW